MPIHAASSMNRFSGRNVTLLIGFVRRPEVILELVEARNMKLRSIILTHIVFVMWRRLFVTVQPSVLLFNDLSASGFRR